MKRKDGFTMIELILVIEIIVILLLLAWPQLRRSYMSARENSAVGSMRTISTGQTTYKTACFRDDDGNGDGDYGTLAQLENPDGAGATPALIDSTLATGFKSGYVFTITVNPGGGGVPPSYSCTAIPLKPGETGYKMFYVDETGLIRCTTDGTAVGPTSTPL